MALIRDQKTLHEIPHEPGQWIELRPLRNGDMIGVDLAGDPYAGTIAMLEKLIVGWSYEDQVTPENVRLLDMKTTTWLGEIMQRDIGATDEKNGSTISS